jgi:hypothetical protein
VWERYTSSFIASRRYFGDQNLPPEGGRTPSRHCPLVDQGDRAFPANQHVVNLRQLHGAFEFGEDTAVMLQEGPLAREVAR